MFDHIAPDWLKKRAKPWQPFTSLFELWHGYWKNNCSSPTIVSNIVLIDLGSGTGRHTPFFKGFANKIINLDISRKMLKLNSESHINIQADLEALPFRNDIVDVAVSVAALHHIKGKNHRIETLKEIMRISKNNSLVYITVWRFYQNKFKKEYFDQIRKCPRESDNEIGDLIVPWALSQGKEVKKINRFYHLYRASEFFSDIRTYHILDKGSFGNKSRFGKNGIKASKGTNFYAVILVKKPD